MKTSKKISRVLLSLIIVLGVSVSSIGSLVYANQINGKTKTGSVSLIGGNRLKQSNYIKNFSNVYTTKTINKSEAVVTYNVTTIDEFKAKVNYAISNRVSEVNINYTGSKSVGDSINFMQDTVLTAVKTAGNDYEKNLLKSYAYSITEFGDNEFNVVYTFDYLETKEQENQVKARVKEILGQIVTPEMTEGQRVKAINSYICKKLSYDTAHTNFSAYEGLLGSGKTVCQGYALLAYRMLTDAGLQARIITGAAYNGNDSESHAWNMVMVGSGWYHLDTTWNDPLPDVNGRVIETYSLCSDAEMRLDHSWDKTLFPVASKKYNVYTDTTVPKILAAMQKSVTLNSSYVSVAKGKVCVKGLLAGDIINVYAVNPALTKGAKAISKATVSKGYSYLFAAFKTTASKLYVTRTSVNKLESVAITIKSK
ncbi:transglutaminase domain-containing protein [Clostridium estertheticum]|uniref:transglutaminase domain-containing protein n=1 Tax=Clostridium estertheticum TaxID=238834 RepID=UPI001CF3EED9|nr:transglutaminase-like domain-containing protein [Clostridium estertheticum]MCB2341721.1 transglutaminase-like domain-containing protein [Clostridium estertheticum]